MMPKLLGITLAGVLLIGGCTQGDTRYSATQLLEGVEVAIEDPDGIVASMTVFLPDDLPSYGSMTPELERVGIAVLDPGEGGYDVVVLYRTGPYCGLLPKVEVHDGSEIGILIKPRTEGDCDTMEYDEALGVDLAPEHEGRPLVATQRRS
jgi:hypothetical protein